MKFGKVLIFIIVFLFLPGHLKAKIDLSAYNRTYHGLAFNMSLDALLGVYRSGLQYRFRKRIASTTDAAERDRLTRQMNVATKALKSWIVSFTKDNNAWDASVLSGEFIKGIGEVMFEKDMHDTKQYFFFHNKKLAKVIEIVTKPLSTYIFRFSSLYGKPNKVYYHGNQTRKPSEIVWEDKDKRFSIRTIGEPFRCVMLRWAQKADDDKWQVLRKKTTGKQKSVDKMVKDVQSNKRDHSVDKKLEELLGPDNKQEKPKSSLQPLLP